MNPVDVRAVVKATGDTLRRRVEKHDERPLIPHLDPYGAPHDRGTCPVCQDHPQTPRSELV